jgi:ABC-2 type transport system permease protein
VLLGAEYCAIGLFASSLTRNQIVAFIIGMVICFSLTLVDQMLFFIPQKILSIIAYIGAGFHFQNISKGIVDTRDVLYFLSVIFIGLFGTNLVMQEKL